MTTTYVSPTASLRCVSAEKATELSARLVAESGCPATSAGQFMTAPIDDIGFVFHVAELAVREGYASDSNAVTFQSAAIDRAEGVR